MSGLVGRLLKYPMHSSSTSNSAGVTNAKRTGQTGFFLDAFVTTSLHREGPYIQVPTHQPHQHISVRRGYSSNITISAQVGSQSSQTYS